MGDQSIPLNDGLGLEQPNGKIVKQKKPVVTTCGLGPCQPNCMKPLANIKLFTASLAILLAFYGALATYVFSVLTTIEKAFGFPSSKSGFITGTNDIGFLITVIPVSYMGSKAHKPMVIGISGLLIGASGVLSAMPYFLWGGGMEESTLAGDVGFNSTEQLTPQMSRLSLCTIRNETVYSALNDTNGCEKESLDEVAARSKGAYVTLVIGQVIIGIAASTLWPLGMTFIDDNVKKHVSSIYLGILFSLRTLSPILGFVLGAVFTSKPVDLKPTNLTPLDPQWVGAWWVGFLACGMIIFLAGIPLLFFPRQLPVPKDDPEKRKKKEEKRANKKKKKLPFAESPMTMGSGGGGDEKLDLKGLLRSLKRLFTNPIYMSIIIGMVFSSFGFTGFYTFIPKYIETQFDITASKASLFLALLSALPSAIGTFCSGLMTSRLRLDHLGLAKVNLILGIIALGLRFVFLFLGCPSNDVINGLTDNDVYNFTESCNANCGCSVKQYGPVCGSDRLTYFTPCHAGCLDLPDDNQTFQDCGCIPDRVATLGPCIEKCNMIIPFGIMILVTTFISGLGMLPGIMLNLRSMEDRDKTLGLGVLLFIFSVVGIPSPIVFGSLIDHVCMVHSNNCGLERCLVYDKTPLKNLIFGVFVCSQIPGIAFGVFIFVYLYKKKERASKHGGEASAGEALAALADNGNTVDTNDITSGNDI